MVCKQFTNCDSLGGSAVVSEYTSNMHQIAAHSTRVIVLWILSPSALVRKQFTNYDSLQHTPPELLYSEY